MPLHLYKDHCSVKYNKWTIIEHFTRVFVNQLTSWVHVKWESMHACDCMSNPFQRSNYTLIDPRRNTQLQGQQKLHGGCQGGQTHEDTFNRPLKTTCGMWGNIEWPQVIVRISRGKGVRWRDGGWGFFIRKSFLELHRKTELQHSSSFWRSCTSCTF